MLKLRRGIVSSLVSSDDRVDSGVVELESGEARRAISLRVITGPLTAGDDVLVNIEALDLKLGSGGFDIVVANLTRGLDAEGVAGAEAMKLNYSPVQHAVSPVEERVGFLEIELPVAVRVGVLSLHGQLAAAVFALRDASQNSKIAYIQTAGGALPGTLSDTVAELLERGLLNQHLTVSPCFGGRTEALTLVGALQACDGILDCDVAIVGPGPGIQGSASTLGHGGIEALTSAHASLALGIRPLIVPRASSGDPRPRHRNLSHHTATVLRLLIAPVDVALAKEDRDSDLAGQIGAVCEGGLHRVVTASTDKALSAFRESGLPAVTMGRSLDEDPLFFRQAIAAGLILAE